MTLKLITLDLDNTLWDVERIIVRAESKMREWIGENAVDALEFYETDTLAVLREEVLKQYPEHRHDFTFLRKAVLTQVMRRAGHDDATARLLAEGAFEVFFTARNEVEFFPGAEAMLTALSRRYRVYSLTNGNADVSRAGIDGYLTHAISSADVGQSKPHRAMFDAALSHAGVSPDHALHVGDHLVDDIAGASNAGLHTLWINLKSDEPPDDAASPDLTATSLDEVAQLIDTYESAI